MLTLRESAERVLFSSSLADKLAPMSYDDRARGAPIAVPDAPSRPAGLAPSDTRTPFPKDLGDPRSRARILHFFANHELLAIELLALALLRFPDADPGWRRGLVAILSEEQQHLQGYIQRLNAAGVQFGDQPLNRYFWSALSTVQTPSAFAAGLSLTFEQANLDYASHFAARFRQVGDDDTASLLDRVLADEITHVAHGVRWLGAWHPGADFWATWTTLLEPPLTPARAKGLTFTREARVSAGIPTDVIDRLSVYSASKGRPPVIGWFVPDVESALAASSRGPVGAPVGAPAVSGIAAQVAGDLATLPMFLLSVDDHVLAPMPGLPWLARLQEAGFSIPAFGEQAPERVGSWLPWGLSPAVCARTGTTWRPEWRDLYDKAWLQARFGERREARFGEREERVARTMEEAERLGGPGMLLKAPFSTAGRGLHRWERAGREGWTARVLAEQGAVVVEPWDERVLDISVQFDVLGPESDSVRGSAARSAEPGPEPEIRVHPWARFLVDGHGRYRGACVGRPLDDVRDPALLRWIHSRDLQAELTAAIRPVALEMARRGFRGPAGVDAYIARSGDSFKLRPLVELNPRVTMGRVAQAVARHVRREHSARMYMVTAGSLRADGDSVDAWTARMASLPPVRLRAGLIEEGVLPLTEPLANRRMWVVLEVKGPQ